MTELINPSRLVTVGTYAEQYNGGKGVTRGYIYKLIKEGKLQTVQIDRIQFIVLPEQPPQ
jgi:hypothetical protein